MLFTLTSVARWSLGKLSLSRRSLQRVQSISQPANPAPASTANGSGASPAATVQSPPSAAQAAYSPTSRRGRTRSESQLPTGRPNSNRQTISPSRAVGRPAALSRCCRNIKVR